MAKMIYKHELDVRAKFCFIDLPVESKILSCDFQDDKLVFWYLFSDRRESTEQYKFMAVHTGQPFDPTFYTYLGTAYDRHPTEPFVVHVYYMKNI